MPDCSFSNSIYVHIEQFKYLSCFVFSIICVYASNDSVEVQQTYQVLRSTLTTDREDFCFIYLFIY